MKAILKTDAPNERFRTLEMEYFSSLPHKPALTHSSLDTIRAVAKEENICQVWPLLVNCATIECESPHGNVISTHLNSLLVPCHISAFERCSRYFGELWVEGDNSVCDEIFCFALWLARSAEELRRVQRTLQFHSVLKQKVSVHCVSNNTESERYDYLIFGRSVTTEVGRSEPSTRIYWCTSNYP